MSFKSDLGNHLVIDDSTDIGSLPVTENAGAVPRDYEAEPEGSGPFSAPFALPLIPRSEWKERIEEMERTKTRSSDICELMGLPPMYQASTLYCADNSAVDSVQVLRAIQGQPTVFLSAASVGAPLKNYRNVGGWASTAMAYIVKNGIAPASMWPTNAINRKYDTPECREERKKYGVTEWWDMQPRNFDQLMTCLLNRIPCAAGFNWMRHAITPIDPVIGPRGEFGFLSRNSGLYRDRTGHFVVLGNRAIPDDCVAPRVAIAC